MGKPKLFVRFDEMTWPSVGEAARDLNWRLRYGGTPTREDILCAASFISAYCAMVYDPRSKRDKVIAKLRELSRAPRTEGDEG